MLPTTIGRLYVGGLDTPFDVMPKLKKGLKDLHNKIIECTWDAEHNQWAFMRERTDKSFPNAYSTALSTIAI
jgi:mRNA-capping enzyme